MSRWRRCLVLLLLAFATTSLLQARRASAGPPERDLWYVISDGEQRYGSIHVVVRQREHGQVEYAVESLVRIEFFGAPQELQSTSSAIVDSKFSLISMQATSSRLSGGGTLHGRGIENGYVIARETEDGVEETTRTFNDGIPSISDLALGDWLHSVVSEAAPDAVIDHARPVRIIAAESGEAEPATVRLVSRGAAGSEWSIEFEKEWLKTMIRLDDCGVMIDQTVATPRTHIVRATQEEAEQIAHRRIPDRELLVFPFDRELPPTRRLKRLDVKLTWKDIPRDEFQLEDSRQSLISLEQEGGEYTALVRLARPAEDGPDIVLPVSREQFAGALGSTDFILPEDEAVARIAAEIVGETTSARAAATAICQWVSEYIEPAMIAETLSGPQVLKRRTGKCTEYSTLFASLARAAGLPTRLALGQRRFVGAEGDTWAGHMWNEVYVGQWIPVDASVNEVGGSLDLLKFIHSDTVMGTQPLRWKLTQSLGVSIADVELIPEPPGEAIEPGLRGTTYTSAEHRFRFSIPDEAWTVEDTKSAGAQVLRVRPPDADLGDSAMFHVTAFSLPKGVAPKVVLDARLRQQRTALHEVEVLLDQAVEINGVAGHRLRFGGTPKSERGVPMRVTEVLLTHNESAVLINLISTIENHEKFGQAFERILSSVTFIE
ncbi:MAG: transglutaminase domain-containing protein [Phycisphaerales bacterium]|nr:transglutaminase domain-containing protein [Phycisphaerales bacterium]